MEVKKWGVILKMYVRLHRAAIDSKAHRTSKYLWSVRRGQADGFECKHCARWCSPVISLFIKLINYRSIMIYLPKTIVNLLVDQLGFLGASLLLTSGHTGEVDWRVINPLQLWGIGHTPCNMCVVTTYVHSYLAWARRFVIAISMNLSPHQSNTVYWFIFSNFCCVQGLPSLRYQGNWPNQVNHLPTGWINLE